MPQQLPRLSNDRQLATESENAADWVACYGRQPGLAARNQSYTAVAAAKPRPAPEVCTPADALTELPSAARLAESDQGPRAESRLPDRVFHRVAPGAASPALARYRCGR